MQKDDNTEPSEVFYSYDSSGLLVPTRASNDEPNQGETISWDGWDGEPLAFAGSSRDPNGNPTADSNLSLTPCRCFDGTEGRWLQLEPMDFAAGDADLYRYPGAALLPAGVQSR